MSPAVFWTSIHQVFLLSCFSSIFPSIDSLLSTWKTVFYHCKIKYFPYTLSPSSYSPFSYRKKKSWKSKYALFFGIVHPSFTFQTIAIWPQQTLDATFTKVNNGFLSTSPTDSFHSSLYEPPCNACHGWLLTILKFCYFPNSIAGLSPCFYSHL